MSNSCEEGANIWANDKIQPVWTKIDRYFLKFFFSENVSADKSHFFNENKNNCYRCHYESELKAN